MGVSSHQTTTTGAVPWLWYHVDVILVLALCRTRRNLLCQATAGEKSFIFLLLVSSLVKGQWSCRQSALEGTVSLAPSLDYPSFQREPLVCSVTSVNIIIKSDPGLEELLEFAVSRPCVT